MAGKILNIGLNDLNGQVDNRKVVVFACFKHIKYMNNYVIFSFLGEYGKNKLYFGSIHIKDDSLIIFSVSDDIRKYMEQFVLEYTSSKLENFELLDIDKIEKVLIVSYSEMEYDKLQLLDDISIKKVIEKKEDVSNKKPIFMYVILFVLILLCIGLTLLYLYPNMFSIKHKELVCTDNIYDDEIMLNYEINKDIKFDRNDKISSINVVRNYTFLDSNSYYEFKENNRHLEYFNDGEGYKYLDSGLSLRIFYKENSVIDDYYEMLEYLKREGYICIEQEYEE